MARKKSRGHGLSCAVTGEWNVGLKVKHPVPFQVKVENLSFQSIQVWTDTNCHLQGLETGSKLA